MWSQKNPIIHHNAGWHHPARRLSMEPNNWLVEGNERLCWFESTVIQSTIKQCLHYWQSAETMISPRLSLNSEFRVHYGRSLVSNTGCKEYKVGTETVGVVWRGNRWSGLWDKWCRAVHHWMREDIYKSSEQEWWRAAPRDNRSGD